jgi:outer membrane lipoprotein-sorting protein
MRSRLERLTLFAILVVSSGCRPPMAPIARGFPPPTARELLDVLRDRASKITSLRAETKVEHTENGERVKVTVDMLIARGGKLRFEARAPIGGSTAAVLVSDGATFALLDVHDNRYLRGPANACNVARLSHIELSPDAVVDALLCSAPLDGEPEGEVRWDARRGRELLTLRTPDGGTELLELDGRDRAWDLLAATRKDAAGGLLWTLTHEKFGAQGGVRLPRVTTVDEPSHKTGARIKFKEVVPNVQTDPAQFMLAPPSGVPVEPADCSQAP